MTFTENSAVCDSADITFDASSISISSSPGGVDDAFISFDPSTGEVSWFKASDSGVTAATFTIDVTGTLQSPGQPSATAQFNLVTALPDCSNTDDSGVSVISDATNSDQ